MRLVIIRLFILLGLLFPAFASAANISLVGYANYQLSGSSVILTADKVVNNDAGGISGTLRMRLWAFSSPYTGSQTGYVLASYSFGQLNGGRFFSGISSGTIAYTPPPNGTWYYTLFVEEYLGSGWSWQTYANFTGTVTVPSSSLSVPTCTLTKMQQGGGYSLSASCSPAVTSYTWSANTGFASTSPGGLIAAPTVTTTYTVTGSNAAGAGNTSSITITVAASVPVVEFYNFTLDNYFITADANEAAAIDGGAAGPGWTRTGNTFTSGGSTSVCRFYGSYSPGPNSHFYTVDPAECQWLIDQQIPTGDPRKLTTKSWNFESLDFVSTPATNQTCPSGTVPVYRAYNNGFYRSVDSNHRITTNLTAIQQQVACGWSNEGVVMCAPSGTTSGGTTSCGVVSFPLLSAYKTLKANGLAQSFTVSGRCNGTGSITITPAATVTTFEGVAALSAFDTNILSFTDCTPASSTSTHTSYYNNNYVPLGSDNGGYLVYLTPPTLPTSVTVGAAGIIGTATTFTNSTKATVVGRADESYVVAAETATTAIVNIISKSYNAAGILTLTVQDRYRISATGALSPVSSDLQFANGNTSHFILTFSTGTVQGGLIWSDAKTAITYNWAAANTYCTTSTIYGLTGWRLPNVTELNNYLGTAVWDGTVYSSNYWTSRVGAKLGTHTSLQPSSILVWDISDSSLAYAVCVH